MWLPIRTIWRMVAPQPWFMPLLLLYVKCRVKPFQNRKQKTGVKIKILAVHSPRYVPDQECLSEHPDIEIWVLPHDVQALVNSIFIRDQAKIMAGLDAIESSVAFREGTIPEIAKGRAKLQEYLKLFIPRMMRTLGVDGMMSCSFFYLLDLDWQIACKTTNTPFFALHKENMQDPVTHPHMIKRYCDMKLKFEGQRLFLYNNLVRSVLLKCGVCDESTITVTGACRMDALFRKVKHGQCAAPRRQVTFFSSHHAIGLLALKNHNGYFSIDRDEGFVNWFDQVHAAIISFARKYPDIEVYIKPKWGGRWIEQIKDSARRIANIDLDKSDIPNLHIVWEEAAQNLIETSSVIVGVNSTTLLESLIIGRPVIVPLFEEAKDKYYDNHIYFKDYQDQVFNVIRSPDLLENAILSELDGTAAKRVVPREMIEDYLGYFDDQATVRVVEQMKKDIIELKNNRK